MPSIKPFVEDSAILDSKQLKSEFYKIRQKEEINNVLRTNLGTEIWYWAEYEADTFLVVALPNKEPQMIVLTTIMLRYGYRTLLRCPCGYRAAKLYLPHKGEEFKCRYCYNLRYKVSNYNKFNRVDQLEKELNLNNKLSDELLKINRPIYNGLPTKRAISIAKLKYKARVINERHIKRNMNREIIYNWKRQRSQCF
jgi:hypothetical protein